jgi:hypothetical protein
MKQLTVIFLTVFFISCKTNNQYKTWLANPQTYSNTVYALNSIVVDNNFPPMIASRNYAYANIAAYEVLAAAYPGQYQSLAGQLKGLSQLKQPDTTNVNYELAALLAFIKLGEAVTFPAGSMEEYKTQLIKTATDKGLPGNVNKASQQFADSIANQIIKWSKGDNYLATRGSIKYTVLDVPGRWIPTPPGYTTAVEPNWNKIRPMVMDSAAQFMPPRPPAFDVKNKNSTYYKALLEVKNIGDSLTDEQKHIAEFWDDNPFKQNVVCNQKIFAARPLDEYYRHSSQSRQRKFYTNRGCVYTHKHCTFRCIYKLLGRKIPQQLYTPRNRNKQNFSRLAPIYSNAAFPQLYQRPQHHYRRRRTSND